MGSMFPSLSEDTITAVLEAQGGDADKACDELLNMAVGDDLFNRSIYIEDNLSASQNLQRFDKQQEDIWRKCKEREEKRLAEQRRKEEDELRRKQKQEQILAERRAKQEASKREEEARLKEGRQDMPIEGPDGLVYGQIITDGCISFETTV